MAVTLLRRKNYLAMIENAARGKNALFRNTYAVLEDTQKDITKDGALSSGRLVSSILYLNKLIRDLHVTVEGTERDMLASGWYQTDQLKEGAVLIWDPVRSNGSNGSWGGNLRTHIGFYIGNNQAISNNSDDDGYPSQHHYTYGVTEDGKPKRGIMKIYWHPVLDQEA